MTDRSVPVGDRNEPPAVSGPALARQALADAPSPSFAAEVVSWAQMNDWLVAGTAAGSASGRPHYFMVGKGRMLAVWISPVTTLGWQTDRWKSWCTRAGVEAHVWRPKDGMAPVEAVLGGIDRDCGQPIHAPDGRRS